MPPVANCPSCGARVEASPGAAAFVYTCRFCGARIPIEPLGGGGGSGTGRPGAGIPEIVRIRLEDVQRREAMSPEVARVAKTAAKGIGCFVVVMTLFPFVLMGAIFAGAERLGLRHEPLRRPSPSALARTRRARSPTGPRPERTRW